MASIPEIEMKVAITDHIKVAVHADFTVDADADQSANWLEKLRKRAKTWSEHRSNIAYKTLDQEREKLIHDVETTKSEIQRVELQLNNLTSALDSDHIDSGSSTDTSENNNSTRKTVLWMISGIVNGLLKLVFCIVFATLIYDAAPTLLKDALPVLVGTQLSSTLITCLITAKYSTVGASIAGPDIIHALVLATMTETVKTKTDDPTVALSTVLFLICFTGLCISLTWLIVARYRLMVVIDFFPVAVVTGFLGCIGYKVLKQAIKIAVGSFWYHPTSMHFWVLLIPALPVGIPMYALKRFHIGSPLISMPYYIFVPMIVFFICVASTSSEFSSMRSNGWMFDEFESGTFWEQWTSLHFNKISWEAVFETLPDTFILVVIITLDAFLKLSSTKDGLSVKMDMVQELYVLGYQNLLSVLCVGSVGYSQVKFNMINYAITNDAQERRPTIIVALLCGILWFAGYPIINWLPRFFLAGLLIYAGLPFLEMVVQAYWRVTKKEFATILIILIVNAVTGLIEETKSRTLLIAVGVGFLLSAFTFILQYAKTSVIRDSLLGQDFQSSVVRAYEEQRLVERLGVRYAIVELEGYIFFGSANQIINWTKNIVVENELKANALKLRYVTMDFKNVENIDFTGASAFRGEVVPLLRDCGCDILFSGMSPKVRRKLRQEGVFKAKNTMEFSDLDHASEYVETSLLERAAYVRAYWLLCDSFRKLHTQAVLKATYEIFEAVLGTEVGNRLWRYAEQIKYPAGSFITREGRFNHTLFLLQRGKVTTFRATDDATVNNGIQRIHTMSRGAFVNEESLFMDVPVKHSTVADEDCVVWAISRESMKQLEAHDPHLSAAILRNVLRMSSLVRDRLEREVTAIDQGTHSHHALSVTDTWSEHAVSKTLGSRVLAEIREMHQHHLANVHDMEIDETFAHVTGAGLHHAHHFHHMNVQVTPASPMASPRRSSGSMSPRSPSNRSGSPNFASAAPAWTTIRPHLSAAQRQDAIECFLFHSVLDESHEKSNGVWEKVDSNHAGDGQRKRSGSQYAREVISITKRRSSRTNFESTEERKESSGMSKLSLAGDDTIGAAAASNGNSTTSQQRQQRQGYDTNGDGRIDAPVTFAGPLSNVTAPGVTPSGLQRPVPALTTSVSQVFQNDTLEAVKGRRISLEELQRAVMDLGLFPTTKEIRQMHDTLGPNKLDRVQGPQKFEDGADVEEFLRMVTVLSVKEMGRSTIDQLHTLFVQHSDLDLRLWRDDLSNLMKTLNHPEDELELEFLMKEWDLDSRGYLDFDAFVSIVAHVLKAEELDEQLEKDFLTFCGEVDVDHPSLQQMHSAITATDIVRVAWARNVLIDQQLAEEMLFDADQSGTGTLSLDDLIACIETVGANEGYNFYTDENERRDSFLSDVNSENERSSPLLHGMVGNGVNSGKGNGSSGSESGKGTAIDGSSISSSSGGKGGGSGGSGGGGGSGGSGSGGGGGGSSSSGSSGGGGSKQTNTSAADNLWKSRHALVEQKMIRMRSAQESSPTSPTSRSSLTASPTMRGLALDGSVAKSSTSSDNSDTCSAESIKTLLVPKKK